MEAEIASVREVWVEALNKGSAEEFVRCITEDAVWLPPYGEAIEGRGAIARWLELLFEQFRYEFIISDERVRLVGRWAVEDAHFRSILHPRKSPDEPLIHQGRYILLWRRVANEWRIERYIDQTEASSTA